MIRTRIFKAKQGFLSHEAIEDVVAQARDFVNEPGGMMSSGNPGCATGVGVGAAGWMGAWQCGASCFILSPTRAAAFAGMTLPPLLR